GSVLQLTRILEIDSPSMTHERLEQRGCGGPRRVPPATLHAAEFDAREQQRQVGGVHHDMIGVRRGLGALGGGRLQSLVKNQKSVAVPMHQLESIETAIEKQEQIAQANIAFEFRLDQSMEPVEALAEINVLGIEKDLGLTQGCEREEGLHRSFSG